MIAASKAHELMCPCTLYLYIFKRPSATCRRPLFVVFSIFYVPCSDCVVWCGFGDGVDRLTAKTSGDSLCYIGGVRECGQAKIVNFFRWGEGPISMCTPLCTRPRLLCTREKGGLATYEIQGTPFAQLLINFGVPMGAQRNLMRGPKSSGWPKMGPICDLDGPKCDPLVHF